MLGGRSWASLSRHQNLVLLSAVSSRLGGIGGAGASASASAATTRTTMAVSLVTTSSIDNGISQRAKSDLSALHHPSLIDVCIIGAVRTPIGGLLGSLSSLTATQLGGEAISAALRAARIHVSGPPPASIGPPAEGAAPSSESKDRGVVDEVIMGNVLSAGLGQAPATQAATFAGLPPTTPAYTVNKVCASGMKAITLAAASIATGSAEVIVAGGMESMTNAPFYLNSRAGRKGTKLGSLGEIEDGMMVDGLTCALSSSERVEGESEGGGGAGGGVAEGQVNKARRSMGSIADAAASEAGISREEQDWYALLSHSRAKEAAEEALAAAAAHSAEKEEDATAAAASSSSSSLSYYAWHGPEIVPVRVPSKNRNTGEIEFDLVSLDDAPSRLDEARLLKLPPAFGPSGTATAGNASPISDGAAALVLCSSSAAAMRGARVLAHVAASADAQLPPERFPFAPAEAAKIALKKAGIKSFAEVDVWEVNEAFASVVLVTAKALGLGSRAEVEGKFNVAGGAVALGHPLGASGAAAVVRLAHAMAARNVAVGVATICNGGGGATAVVLRRLVREDGEPDDED